jgi:HD-GYP domain-containing protein (c-di-GMP phosphodiesterase class II)
VFPESSYDVRATRVSLSEVLSALSYALDLTEGQAPGHTVRTCAVGMRLGDEVGLGAEDRSALYYALLLKDAGCSSNAARMATLFAADDRVVKPALKVQDWHKRIRLAFATARQVGRGLPLATRVTQFLAIARTPNVTRDLTRIRCERGAEIAQRLGFPTATADAIRSLDEHWAGLGYPEGRRGEEIPLLARIALIAQTVDAFHTAKGLRDALAVLRARSGTWFDPRLVKVVAGWRRDESWWRSLHAPALGEVVVALEPTDHVRHVDEPGLDGVARTFAEIIDAKSPYTFQHSAGVSTYAVQIARQLGLESGTQRRIARAGLLHDIGKLGVSNRILDKAGALTADERRVLELHPTHTFEILSRVAAFAVFALTAALHHEKLDGSGYPWHQGGARLDQPARILTVADMYEALTAHRPYRAAFAADEALRILRRDAIAGKLDERVVDALAAVVAGGADGARMAG